MTLVRAHRYVLAGGTIGASGLADPKRIRDNDVIYHLRHPPKNRIEKFLYWLSDTRDRIFWAMGIEVD